jgi:hypothetical protein
MLHHVVLMVMPDIDRPSAMIARRSRAPTVFPMAHKISG